MTLTDEEHIQSLRTGITDEEIAQRYPNAHAEALAWRRRRLKLSLEDAAAALELAPVELEQIEAGSLAPTDAQLVRIAAYYRYSLERLRKSFVRAAQATRSLDGRAPERRLRQAQPRFGAQDGAAFRRHKSQLDEALC